MLQLTKCADHIFTHFVRKSLTPHVLLQLCLPQQGVRVTRFADLAVPTWVVRGMAEQRARGPDPAVGSGVQGWPRPSLQWSLHDGNPREENR